MKPLHEELKEIRLKRGVSLEDIYTLTKIRPAVLEKIEEGDFSVAPEPFIRAFLREYAEAAGIDPDRVIARYENKAGFILEEFQIEKKKFPKEIAGEPEADQNDSLPENKDVLEKEQPEKTTQAEDKPIPPVDTSPVIVNEPETPATAPEGSPEIQQPSKAAFIVDDKSQPAEDRKETVHEYSSSLDIEKPHSSQGLLLGIFIIVIVIAALIIVYVNGGR